jgi:hypothetical protein
MAFRLLMIIRGSSAGSNRISRGDNTGKADASRGQQRGDQALEAVTGPP